MLTLTPVAECAGKASDIIFAAWRLPCELLATQHALFDALPLFLSRALLVALMNPEACIHEGAEGDEESKE
ncbi:hypothetical protein QHF89_18830 [Polyangium sorediatum]|uniref:Uncharacterized protein n=1 Tax=Polyangium sorediatum TaxID=889274 RepID=A0ABT6NTB3_9BACT|nr:hypothetical protein [Polyangium sorediatum]